MATGASVDTISMANTVSAKGINLVLTAGGDTRHVGPVTAMSAKASKGTVIKPQESVAARTITFALLVGTLATLVIVFTLERIRGHVTL